MFHCTRVKERTECKNYRGISLSMVGKIYSGLLVDRICRETGALIDDEQRSFRAGRESVDQILALKNRLESTRKKMQCMRVL